MNGRRLSIAMLWLVGISMATAGGLIYLTDAQRFPVTDVQVAGELRHVDRTHVRAVVNEFLGDGFFNFKAQRLAAALVDQVPWVAAARINRLWPGGIRVDVMEHAPIARWNDDYLLSERGILFEPRNIGSDVVQLLPRLYGPQGLHQRVINDYRRYRHIMHETAAKITAVRLDERGAWRLEFDNRFELLLGQAEVERRLQRFTRAFTSLLQLRSADILSVDMRYQHGFSVRWRPTAVGALDRAGSS